MKLPDTILFILDFGKQFMDKIYEMKYHELEPSNWWFVSRRDAIYRFLLNTNTNAQILEIGCSGGQLLLLLASKGFSNVYGIDVSNEAISRCNKMGIKNVSVMDGTKTSFRDNTFNIIVASDVLEHINDQNAALSEWKRILRPGGTLILFVPAFMFLWSGHDEVNHHFRRYSLKQLNGLLRFSGFKIIRSSYWNFSLFFPILVLRLIDKTLKRKSTRGLYALHPLLNALFIKLLSLENSFLKKLSFPFGVSVFAIVKKV